MNCICGTKAIAKGKCRRCYQREYYKEYYKTHPEQLAVVLAAQKRWRIRNPEYFKEYRKAWNERNPFYEQQRRIKRKLRGQNETN